MARKKTRNAPSQNSPGVAASDSTGAPLVANNMPHGTRQAVENLSSSAPASGGGSAGSPPSPAGSPMLPFSDPETGAFGPTERPDEDIRTGALDQSMLPNQDPNMMLRAMYAQFPHPDLLAMLQRII